MRRRMKNKDGRRGEEKRGKEKKLERKSEKE